MTAITSPRRAGIVLPLGGLLLGAVLGGSAAADPLDPFGTHSVLERGDSGHLDPLGRECRLRNAPLSLPAAVEFALCRSPATRAAWAAAHQQAAALGVAESAWLPTLTGTGSETWTNGDRVDPVLGPVVATEHTSDVAVNLSWTLFDFGARGGRIASARRLLDASAATANRATQQTVLGVVQSYYSVVAADASLIAAKTTEAASARSLDVARGRRDAGIATRADVLQAETAFDQAVLTRVQVESGTHTTRGALAVAIGLTADQALVLDPDPVPREVPALTGRMAELIAAAERQRPDLAAARAQRDAAEADVTVARAAGRPSITIGAGHDYAHIPGYPRQNYNTVGINLTVPLFSGFSTTYGVRQALAALEVREANAEQIRLAVSQDVWNAYYTLASANQQLQATAALTKAAAESEEVALGRYENGVGTILDVLTAQTASASARQQRVAAELGWQVARAELVLALGRLSGAEPLASGAASP